MSPGKDYITMAMTSIVGLSDGIKLLLTSRVPYHQPTGVLTDPGRERGMGRGREKGEGVSVGEEETYSAALPSPYP